MAIKPSFSPSHAQDLQEFPKIFHSGESAHFVGRQDALKTLHRELDRSDRASVSALEGMGGIGKTELTVQYARQRLQDYPGGGCWLQARTGDLLAQVVEYVQNTLGHKMTKLHTLRTSSNVTKPVADRFAQRFAEQLTELLSSYGISLVGIVLSLLMVPVSSSVYPTYDHE